MKRREFVVKSSLAALGLSRTGLYGQFKQTKSANETIQIGVIGTGQRGAGLIPFLQEIDHFNVAACCDVLPFRLEEALKRAPNARPYDNYEELLSNKDIDAVLIATPFYLHDEVSLAAIDAGKHVYCEKTMAKGIPEIQALVKKVEKSSLIFQTGHQYHSSRLYTHVVDLIKNQKIGKIAAVECQWNRHGNWRREVPSPELERAINWRMYKEYSGGLAAELCSHQIDFTNWILNETPIHAMGIGGIDYWKDGRETFDNIHLMYAYPGGVKATFTCLTSNALDGYKIKVLGDKGTIILDYTKAWYLPETDEEKILGEADGVTGATVNWEKDKGYPIKVDHINPSKQALVDFGECIKNNTQPVSDVLSGAKTSMCVNMGLEAMHEKKIVQWHSLEN
ncbi:Gfo/Idh/MocA family protein [Namhaeicola litoreus]|uniref:Gfo/Idh/MocA family protein n=1 Tax=Namhaeicola litoreus TaxID=1052145 RepID=A0ABW3Y768_9FLAO